MKKDTKKVEEQPKMSFGIELEWSDTDRTVDIPTSLGHWEGPKIAGYYMGAEIDIVNTLGKWKGVGTDPLAITCPVGGEINVQPASSPEILLNRIMEIMDLFPTIGTGCVNHGHIHVHVEGLATDLGMIQNVFEYTEANELETQKALHSWDETTHWEVWGSELEEWVKTYLQYDGCRSINPEVYRLVEKATSIGDVLNILRKVNAVNKCWITGEIKETTSNRTAINLFNLTKGDTVEFRCLRSSKNPVEIYSSLVFVKRYMEEAIKGKKGKPVVEILKEGNFKFPTLDFNLEEALGWQKTRHKKGRSGPFKKYSGTVRVHDEIATDMSEIVELCKKDLNLSKVNTSRGKVIALTGAHSTGKSTILKELKKLYPELHCLDSVTRKVTTTEQRRLEEMSDNVQERIFEGIVQMEQEVNRLRKTETVVLDRSFLDFTAYTLAYYGKGLISNSFAEKIFRECQNRLKSGLYDIIFYFPVEFDIVDDGVRSFDKGLQIVIDTTILSMLEFYGVKFIPVTGSVEERLNIIKQYI